MSGTTIKLSPQGNNAEFTYDVVSDTNSQHPVHGFLSQAFHVNNVQRVEEHDWKMVYLNREHGDRPGNISWHFDLNSLGKPIEKIEVRMAGIRTFESGQVLAMAYLGDACMKLPDNESALTLIEPRNSGLLKIEATLSGGHGSCAFQKAQIFRTELNSGAAEGLSVKIWLKN